MAKSAPPARPAERLQIGEVTSRVGLSLRTVRYYEEVGLITPLSRTEGGFRLYGAEHVDRLELIKQMKPLGFSIEEMRDLLEARDLVRARPGQRGSQAARKRLHAYAELASERVKELKTRLRSAEAFARALRADTEATD